jgi:hypothetical protein
MNNRILSIGKENSIMFVWSSEKGADVTATDIVLFYFYLFFFLKTNFNILYWLIIIDNRNIIKITIYKNSNI